MSIDSWDEKCARINNISVDELWRREKERNHISDIELLKQENKKLKRVINHLILSADCTWEQNNEGNDWKDAIKEARELIK